ncbi:dehydrogenase [Litorimonas cladophorae]|uniref:Dehydrogenase n=1 Tax=Litorimonas cladophorae TaxID=1220491 RepID=A0A918KUQ9_9PROT|nr:PQQ-dependent sugar dehydrogenase [Litorimonas cladophorae]GGX74217.1 dehydrogenase [Litorimonas cladophorae]
MRSLLITAAIFSLAAAANAETITGTSGSQIELTELAQFDGAWAMTFLPDGRLLVTEQSGSVWLVSRDGEKLGKIGNVPEVTERGQGGLGDIIIDPDFASNRLIYLSYVERDANDNDLSGAVVDRATLTLSARGGALVDRERIWDQSPKMTGNGHYAHRMAFSPETAKDGGGYLYVTSGDRQKFTPAQNMDMNLGKVVRINSDGSIPSDNPFSSQSGVTAQIWTLGHRNPLGIDFDADGRLWVHEMGPRDGDELNNITRSANYGYPVVSNGKHYSGVEIPDHDANPVYKAPAEYWVPAISPAGFKIYDGTRFSEWTGDGFIGGLSSQALIRVEFEDGNRGPKAKEAERFEWGKRIREVETGLDGAIYVLEDNDGRLLRITPK